MKKRFFSTLLAMLLIFTMLPTTALAAGSDATLSALTLTGATLSPAFSSGTLVYTASVANSVTEITIAATRSDSDATMTLKKGSGSAVAWDGTASTQTLDVGENVFTIAVTSEDSTTLKTYTVTVTRVSISGDATLSALTLTGATLSPAFSSGTLNYTASVANSVTGVTIAATKNHAGATMTLKKGSGSAVAWDGTASAQALDVGVNVFTIAVTAEDGTTNMAYTVTVTRSSTSDDATLSALTLTGATLSPAFSSGTLNYTASVANSVTGVTIAAAKNHAGATMTLKKGSGSAVAWDGTASAQTLDVGANVFTIAVTAEDGTTNKAYTVTVTRSSTSDDATLSALTLTGATLSPAFASGTLNYTASVANSVTGVTIAAAKNHAGATMTLKKGSGSAVAWDGTASAQTLDVGANVFTIAVTAEDGTTNKEYTVTVTRAGSGDATLSALTLTGATLSPAFTSDRLNYTALVANSVTGVTIAATKNHAGATMTLKKGGGSAVAWDGAASAQTLSVGENVFTIAVTAENGTTKRSYTVTVTRADDSSSTPTFQSRTLWDSATGVRVTGERIHKSARLSVSSLALHSSDTACNAIRRAQKEGRLIRGFNISLSYGFRGEVTVSIPVGDTYNGQIVNILHCADGGLETINVKVRNGAATFDVTELSPFAVVYGAYVPPPVIEPPKTGGAVMPLGFLLIGLASGCALFIAARRRKS